MNRINNELRDALDILGKERGIPREALFDTIESSLLTACRNHFGKSDNCVVEIDRNTYNYKIYQLKRVCDEVKNPSEEISLSDALMIDPFVKLEDTIKIPVDIQNFGRISTQNAKGVIKQKIREEERNSVYREFIVHEHGVMTGVVQKINERGITVNLGKADAMLSESEQIRGEILRPNQRVKVYLLEVKNNPRGPRILVSRTHPDLVKCLFSEEISEIADGSVEIKRIAREAGSRTKIAVISHDKNVDPVGACVGVNGVRVNAIVDELGGEKIDIVNWDENPAFLIENALSPAKVIVVVADEDIKGATVIVPDYQLSLAIGKEGQNARLAAKLTGYKIDIKSESEAQESGLLEELGMEVSKDDDASLADEVANKNAQGEEPGLDDFGDDNASFIANAGSEEESQDKEPDLTFSNVDKTNLPLEPGYIEDTSKDED